MYDAADLDPRAEALADRGRRPGDVGGSSLPGGARRAESHALSNYGIGLEDVRTVLATANANRPKGELPTISRPGD